jgi:hypothetical protein
VEWLRLRLGAHLHCAVLHYHFGHPVIVFMALTIGPEGQALVRQICGGGFYFVRLIADYANWLKSKLGFDGPPGRLARWRTPRKGLYHIIRETVSVARWSKHSRSVLEMVFLPLSARYDDVFPDPALLEGPEPATAAGRFQARLRLAYRRAAVQAERALCHLEEWLWFRGDRLKILRDWFKNRYQGRGFLPARCPRFPKRLHPPALSDVLADVFGGWLLSRRCGENRDYRLPDGRVYEIRWRFWRERGTGAMGQGPVELVKRAAGLSGPGADQRAVALISQALGTPAGWMARHYHVTRVRGGRRLREAMAAPYEPIPEDPGAWPRARRRAAADLGLDPGLLDDLRQRGLVYAQWLGWVVFPCVDGAFVWLFGAEGPGRWLLPGKGAGPWILEGPSDVQVLAAGPVEALEIKARRPDDRVLALGPDARWTAVKRFLVERRVETETEDMRRLFAELLAQSIEASARNRFLNQWMPKGVPGGSRARF